MKKTILAVLTSVIVFLDLFSFSSFAVSANPAEAPNVKVYVNCRPVILKDLPLMSDGSILLPMAAVLKSLGIPDDSKHIKMNSKEKSATVVNGKDSIYLKAGDKAVSLNKKKIQMDITPVLYSKNLKLYIPLQFISKVLGKAVVCDKYTNTVYVREKAIYDSVRSDLKKVQSSMNAVIKVKMDTAMKLDISDKNSKIKFDVVTGEELDKSAKTLFSNTNTTLVKGGFTSTSYYAGNSEYRKDSSMTGWDKTYLDDNDFKAVLSEDTDISTLNSIDVMAAGMEENSGGNPGELLFKGDVYPNGLVKNLSGNPIFKGVKAEKYNIEAVIDIKTNLVSRMNITLEGSYTSSRGVKSQMTIGTLVTYSDYNGKFEVTVPEGLLLN